MDKNLIFDPNLQVEFESSGDILDNPEQIILETDNTRILKYVPKLSTKEWWFHVQG